MNPEVKEKWLNELRKPDARQTKKVLKSDMGECCLGVLCRIAVDEGVIDSPTEKDGIYFFDGEFMTLPSRVGEWAGLDSHNPFVVTPIDYTEGEGDWAFEYRKGANVVLASLNDNTELGFSGIADIIEEQL